MPNLSELNAVERPVTEWLSKMGWSFKDRDELKAYNRPFSNPIIAPPLLEKICQLNGLLKPTPTPPTFLRRTGKFVQVR